MLSQQSQDCEIALSSYPLMIIPEIENEVKPNLFNGNKIKKIYSELTEKAVKRKASTDTKFTLFALNSPNENNLMPQNQSIPENSFLTKIRFKTSNKLSSYQLYKSQQKEKAAYPNRLHLLRRRFFHQKIDQKEKSKSKTVTLPQKQGTNIDKSNKKIHNILSIDGNSINHTSIFDSPKQNSKYYDKYIKTAEGRRKRIDPLTLLRHLVVSKNSFSTSTFLTMGLSSQDDQMIPFTKSIVPLKSHFSQHLSAPKQMYNAHKAMKKQKIQQISLQKSTFRPWSPNNDLILVQDLTSLYDKCQKSKSSITNN